MICSASEEISDGTSAGVTLLVIVTHSVTLSAGAAVLTAASIIKMWRGRVDCGVNNVSHNTATLD